MRWAKSIISLSVLAIVAVSASVLFYVLEPIGFRNTLFLPVREAGLFFSQMQPVSARQKIRRIELPDPESVIVDGSRPQDIRIVADIYRQADAVFPPGILLLHGSSVYGRRNALTRLLAHELQNRGWTVLAPDARGFGDTENPAGISIAENWSVESDIRRSLQFLVESGADPRNLHVFGHSLGVDHALEGALGNPMARSLVLASPGIYREGSTGRWQLVRFSADRHLPEVLTLSVVQKIRAPGSINGLAQGALREPRKQPVMLMYGNTDNPSVVADYERLGSEIALPFRLHAVPGAGHWFGVRSIFGSNTVYYRTDVFESFLDVLVDFIEASGNE